MKDLQELQARIIECRRCPRLVEWREKVALEKTRRFSDWAYWGKPVPGFGDPQARLLVIGLAPAAHGANRTGRMFTGDRSGDWLYRALFKAGFANQSTSEHRTDGLQLQDCYITALCRCAPPANKPTADEFSNCREYLEAELNYFLHFWETSNKKAAILCLGQLSYQHTLRILKTLKINLPNPTIKFRHGLDLEITADIHLYTSYHPSQQNTFTGRLTEEMLDGVFEKIRAQIGK